MSLRFDLVPIVRTLIKLLSRAFYQKGCRGRYRAI
jgi:hypothetical protein